MSGKGRALDVVGAAMVAMIMLVMHFDTAKAANYVVGMDGTLYYWSAKSNPNYYPSGMTLSTGDTLEFKYDNGVHNVVGVGPTGYQNCDGRNGRMYTSGVDTIALKKGWNYFICTKTAKNENRNMCSHYKMKIAIKAN